MAIFSNRHRPVPLGPYPLERLPRTDRVPVRPPGERTPTLPSTTVTSGSLEPSARRLQKLYEELASGTRSPELAEIPDDPRVLADNLKATGYFLDASMVGICALPEEARRLTPSGTEDTIVSHTHAVVVLVAHGQRKAAGTLETRWLTGTEDVRADVRSMEIAAILAGYIRNLGYEARAHARSDDPGAGALDQDLLTVAAGLGLWHSKGGSAAGRAVFNPFVGTGFRTAVVTTDLPLQADLPLRAGALRNRLAAWSPAYLFGRGGTRPGLRSMRGDHRPLHMSRFPMERIKRRPTPTTHISDAVPRMPKRANFFVRAAMGDLGERAQQERPRFATKHPLVQGMAPLLGGMQPLQTGSTAAEPAAEVSDAVGGSSTANAAAVKAACHFLDADLVGICEAPEYAWYSHQQDGTPIAPYHRYAIVILIDQGFETMEGASGDDWISGAQSMRAYLRSAEITNIVADHIRGLGYSARSHTQIDSDVLHIPLILQAGLGEMSRIGELVLNPFVGPRFKSAVITTDLPMTVDEPIDFGLQDFCEQCNKCARECPCNAIPAGGKVMFNGYEIWKPDVERCAKYRLTNMKGSACGRCMKTCPYNTEGLLVHRAFLWAAIHLPFTRKWIARLDDLVGNGRRNPTKRWWFDLEVVDGKPIKPRGTNERDLNLAYWPDPQRQKIAHFPFDLAPPPGGREPFPVNRPEGLRRGENAEAPPPRR